MWLWTSTGADGGATWVVMPTAMLAPEFNGMMWLTDPAPSFTWHHWLTVISLLRGSMFQVSLWMVLSFEPVQSVKPGTNSPR